MESIDLMSAIVTCHMEVYNWLRFQAEGHSITVKMREDPNCPSCKAKKMPHTPDDLIYHANDQVWCLNLFTPGTNPADWKNTGIQCIRVQHWDRNECIKLMQEAIINTVYAFARQEHGKVVAQAELDKVNMERNLFHMFMAKNFSITPGQTPFDIAARFIRTMLKANSGAVASDTDELLPQNWRRD